jgi:hypothetical protein
MMAMYWSFFDWVDIKFSIIPANEKQGAIANKFSTSDDLVPLKKLCDQTMFMMVLKIHLVTHSL